MTVLFFGQGGDKNDSKERMAWFASLGVVAPLSSRRFPGTAGCLPNRMLELPRPRAEIPGTGHQRAVYDLGP